MAKENGMEQCYKVIFEALEKGGGIGTVIGTIACGLQVPVAVVDPYGEILADSYTSFLGYSAAEQEEERNAWISMMEEYYTRELKIEESGDSPVVVCLKEAGTRILSAITVKGGLEGFCVTLHEMGDENDCEVNRLICRGLSIGYGRKDHVYNLKDSGARQVVSKLLLGNGQDTEYIPRIRENIYEAYAVPPFLLALTEFKKQEETNLWEFRNCLSGYFQDALIYMERNQIVILFVHIDSVKKKERICEYLRQGLEGMECVCAVSEPFTDQNLIQVKRKMLKRILLIADKVEINENLYTEYQYYMELVCSYAYDAMGVSGCFQEELSVLEQEDDEKGTEFYKSLKEYLLSGNNVNLAAKKLFIHRNTMVYRLAKIHEMLKLDINDPEIAKRLMLSMLLRTFQ